MRTIAFRLISIFILLSFSISSKAHVVLDYPTGGETFVQGQVVNILWHISVPHELENWDLFFSSDGGIHWDTLQLDMPPGQLEYLWTIPSILTSQGRIKIYMQNVGMDYVDISMNFNIIENTSPPSLDAPATDLTLECSAGNQQAAIQNWLDNHGGAVASNFCSDLVWTNDFDQLSNDCGATGSASVTFTASDECGSTYSIATVSVTDTQSPTLIIPAANATVESDGNGNHTQFNAWLLNHAGSQASDVCGSVAWTHSSAPLVLTCGSAGNATVIFTATDQCGNATVTTATFTIIDTTPPSIVHAARDTSLACASSNQSVIQSWLSNHAGAAATDIGSTVSWSNNYSGLSDECGQTGSALVTFVATDECGNSTSTIASVSVNDHEAPVIDEVAHDTSIICGNADQEAVVNLWIERHGGAHASDACGNVIWTHDNPSLVMGCMPNGMTVFTFTATDECGNTSFTTAGISISDTIPPVIDVAPIDTIIMCGIPDQQFIIDNWLSRHGGAVAHDACGDVSWTNDFPVQTELCDSTVTYIVHFTVVDGCQNSNITQASFTIAEDTTTAVQPVKLVSFSIYPNPAHDNLHIELNDLAAQAYTVTLTDLMGRTVLIDKVVSNQSVLNVHEIHSGVYFLQLFTGKEHLTQKVIIE